MSEIVVLERPTCRACEMGLPRWGDYFFIRCRRAPFRLANKNPNDCCIHFLPPSPGYDYPQGSTRDQAVRPDLAPLPMQFDPKRGLIRV